MDQYKEERKEQETVYRLEEMKRMHEDKMQVLSGLTEELKGLANKTV